MGIKENFSQAVRELTGAGKDEKRTDKSTVDGMRNAVAAEDTSEFMAVKDNRADSAADDFEEIERRAAMEAESLSRQQDAFNQGEFAAEPDVQPEETAEDLSGGEQQYIPPQFSQQSYGGQTPPPPSRPDRIHTVSPTPFPLQLLSIIRRLTKTKPRLFPKIPL